MTTTNKVNGTMRRLDDTTGAVRMETVLGTDIDDAWDALTDPARLARWIAEVTGDLRVGGEVYTKFTSTAEGPGRIEVCEPPRRLLVAMFGVVSDDTAEIEAVLTPEGDGTRLVIEERGLPMSNLFAHGAGWQAHVEDLVLHLAGQPAGNWKERWDALSSSYRDQAKDL